MPKVQEEVRTLKEEQYQGEFLEDLFVKILGYTKPASSSETPYNLTTEYINVKDIKLSLTQEFYWENYFMQESKKVFELKISI